MTKQQANDYNFIAKYAPHYAKQYEELVNTLIGLKNKADGIVSGINSDFYPLELEIDMRKKHIKYLEIINDLENNLKEITKFIRKNGDKKEFSEFDLIDLYSVIDY